MIYLLFALAAAGAAYQLLALIASIRHGVRLEIASSSWPAVSILKPVRGIEPHFYEAIRSHAEQLYPEFEILFGVADAADPALAEIDRLAAQFPHIPIRSIVVPTDAANRKVGVLAGLAKAARHPILVVNDSDIRVPSDYLRRIVAPLEDERNGMVTCLYRARSDNPAGRFEAIGIATEFAPSVLVAPLVGVAEFALGSTMVFRARDLERIGGFRVLEDYLADDYQLSRHIRALGLEVVISRVVVETSLPEGGWTGVWNHQLRWARTIRVSRTDGYIGMPIIQATLWAVLLAAAGFPRPALGLAGLRMASGVLTARLILGDRRILSDFLLIPLRDLWGMAIWVAGLFGRTVEWRGRRLRLDKEGKIVGAA